MSWTATLFATALDALSKKPKGSGSPFGSVTKSVLRYPIKTIAAFVTAPFLAFRVARSAKNPTRRVMAGIGLFIAITMAWLAGTLIGTATGALLIMSHMGLMWGLAFFVGTTLSVTLSVIFSILVLNATAWFFLHMSSEEVIDYLRSISG